MDHLIIIHWNIEGLISKRMGSKLDDAVFHSVTKGYDVIALTETHLGNAEQVSIPGYIAWHKMRPKNDKAKKFSGGISVFIREELKPNISFIPSNSNDILWVKFVVDKQAVCTLKDIVLGIVYISPSNSSYTANNTMENDQTTWDILMDELLVHKTNSNVCLMDDFNAHTGHLKDYIDNDDDKFLILPDDYSADAEPVARSNCDVKTNEYGRTLIDLCKSCEMRIVNGRKMGDTLGNLTCHKYNGSSTVDYLISDTTLLSFIQTFQVGKILESISPTTVP